MRRLVMMAATALILAIGVMGDIGDLGSHRLHLAFEDRGDPRPRQLAIDGQIAGICLAFVVSWTNRAMVR